DGDPKHLELAKKALDTAMRVHGDLGEIHRELGRYYFYIRDHDHAAQELNIARRMLPNDAETHRVMGELDRQRNRWNESVSDLQRAYELDPRNGEILHHLRTTYHWMRRYAEEKQLLDRALLSE